MSGKLILIPTPIDDNNSISVDAHDAIIEGIERKDIFCVEEHKAGRRRWLRFNLPRETIEDFVLYNEHTRTEISNSLISSMKSGKNVYLMSDCGLPAFCDPGSRLVNRCHQTGIQVTSSSFFNSISLAVALSGFNHDKFNFMGFLPKNSQEAKKELESALKSNIMSVAMDTPYKLTKLLRILSEISPNREVFLGLNLNQVDEVCVRETTSKLYKRFEGTKAEFILVIGRPYER